MNAKEFNRLLVRLDACDEARAWAKGKSLAEVWERCDRAELALPFVPLGELRPSQAIETARRWAQGKATRNEVIAAWRAAADAAYAAGGRLAIRAKCLDIVRRQLKPAVLANEVHQ